jgi:hypothetical protein
VELEIDFPAFWAWHDHSAASRRAHGAAYATYILQMEGRKRDLAMFNLAVDSKLRGCDLVRLKVDDVSAGGRVRDHPEEDGPTGSIRNRRANPERYRRLAVQPWWQKGSAPVSEPFPEAAASIDTPIRAHRPSMG